MNYREWLLYRAQQYQAGAPEPQILRYSTWQNYKAMRDWMRRSDAAHLPSFPRNEPIHGSNPS
jgi:hypothetical protein